MLNLSTKISNDSPVAYTHDIPQLVLSSERDAGNVVGFYSYKGQVICPHVLSFHKEVERRRKNKQKWCQGWKSWITWLQLERVRLVWEQGDWVVRQGRGGGGEWGWGASKEIYLPACHALQVFSNSCICLSLQANPNPCGQIQTSRALRRKERMGQGGREVAGGGHSIAFSSHDRASALSSEFRLQHFQADLKHLHWTSIPRLTGYSHLLKKIMHKGNSGLSWVFTHADSEDVSIQIVTEFLCDGPFQG